MNTRPPIEAPSEPTVLSVAFNDNGSLFSAGMTTGFLVFESATGELQTARDFGAGLGLVQMLGLTNFVALVGGGRAPKFPQNKVVIWDEVKQKVVLEITMLTAVRGVQLNRNRVVVVLQNSIRVYKFAKQPQPLGTYASADNPLGLCRLSPDDKYLVFPGRTAGQVHVVDEKENVSIIPAHSSKLQALALSADGQLIATASEKGTIVRIFTTSNCAKIAERRRGSESATIHSLSFSPSGRMLACTSSKGSLHIFDVPAIGRGGTPPHRAVATGPGTPHQAPSGGLANGGAAHTPDSTKKWGFLSNIPFGPFSDVYSFTSIPFASGDEEAGQDSSPDPALGTTQPVKGVVGWVDEHKLVVVGAGRDPRWERFRLAPVEGEEGKTRLVREGWKRYTGG